MEDLKAGVEHVEQSVKDAATKAGQEAKVGKEKTGEKATDTTDKIEQDVKQVGER
jgi:hypothetical protein